MGVWDKIKASKTDTPRCLVLLAACNGEKYLSEQLYSIRAQINVEVDIFFSDDGSRDKTVLILSEFGCNNLNPTQQRYFSACDNFLYLVKNADIHGYDYIFLCDQDDIWLPTKLQRAIEQLTENKYDCYSGSYYIYDKKRNKIKHRNKYFKQTDCEHFFRSPGPGFTYSFTNEAFAKIQKKIKDINSDKYQFRWHDWLLYALAVDLNLKWLIDHEAHALYRQHDLNDTGQNTSLAGIIYRLKFLFSGKYREEVLKICSVVQNTEISDSIKRFSFVDRLKLVNFVTKMRSSKREQVILFIWLLLGKK